MREVNLTEGPILRRLIAFSMPMILGNLLQQIYSLVDTFIVGRVLGAGALAAVGSAYTLMVFVTSVIIGLCMGSGAFFSVDYGAGDRKKLGLDLWLSFWFIAGVTILLYLILYPFMGMIQKVLHIPMELREYSTSYSMIVFSGIIFVFFYNFFAYLLRAMGNSFVSLAFLAVSSIVNIILDILFVLVFRLGIAGAAWATVIAQALAGVGIFLYAVLHVSLLRYNPEWCHFDGQRLKEIIYNDVMTALQQSVMNFGILMIQGLVNSFGAVIMAAFAAAVKIDTVAYMPSQEFGNAFSLFVSQNYGAKKEERIRDGLKVAFLTSIAVCVVLSVITAVFAEPFMKIFVDPGELAIIAEGVRYLRIEGSLYIGIGILFLWYGYFRAINKPQLSLILTIISLGTRVAVSYAFAPRTSFGVVVIWCAIPLGWFLADTAGYIYVNRERKRKNDG